MLLWLVAGWAILSGALQIAVAVQFRKVIRGEWMLGLAGALGIVFGVLLIARPGVGLLTLALLIGWFSRSSTARCSSHWVSGSAVSPIGSGTRSC